MSLIMCASSWYPNSRRGARPALTTTGCEQRLHPTDARQFAWGCGRSTPCRAGAGAGRCIRSPSASAPMLRAWQRDRGQRIGRRRRHVRAPRADAASPRRANGDPEVGELAGRHSVERGERPGAQADRRGCPRPGPGRPRSRRSTNRRRRHRSGRRTRRAAPGAGRTCGLRRRQVPRDPRRQRRRRRELLVAHVLAPEEDREEPCRASPPNATPLNRPIPTRPVVGDPSYVRSHGSTTERHHPGSRRRPACQRLLPTTRLGGRLHRRRHRDVPGRPHDRVVVEPRRSSPTTAASVASAASGAGSPSATPSVSSDEVDAVCAEAEAAGATITERAARQGLRVLRASSPTPTATRGRSRGSAACRGTTTAPWRSPS